MRLRRGIKEATRRLRPSCGAARGAQRTGESRGRSTRPAGSSSMNAPTTDGSNWLPWSERISETVASMLHAAL
jgi:hypothetical protein